LRARQVVVTGIGIICPLGNSREQAWSSLIAGGNGAEPIGSFAAGSWPTNFACEVKDFQFDSSSVKSQHLDFLSRPTQFGAMAAAEAMEDSGIGLSGLSQERFGVCVGSGIGAMAPDEFLSMMRDMTGETPKRVISDSSSHGYRILQNHPGTLAAVLGARWQAHGPVSTIHTACASSGQSVGHALQQIRRGEADVMLSGGADSLLSELLLAGFCLIGALSTRNEDPKAASRPFDRGRDGFVAGEGAAMLVLEEREHATRRGAKIYAELAGYGESESAFRITDLPPNGRGVVEAMHTAVNDAEISYDSVGYINAHGTSTELNDRIESLAVRRVFQSRGARPYVGSTKSATGHLISAAGALEAAFCILALRDQKIPPTLNLENTDCGDDVAFTPTHCLDTKELKAAMSNSIGFGGSNSSLLFARCRP